LISYDTQPIAIQKADYINGLGLGGAMWWQLDADAPEETGRALVRTMRERLGQLEWRENELDYPGSSEFCGTCTENGLTLGKNMTICVGVSSSPAKEAVSWVDLSVKA
jgi:hypothetical protein